MFGIQRHAILSTSSRRPSVNSRGSSHGAQTLDVTASPGFIHDTHSIFLLVETSLDSRMNDKTALVLFPSHQSRKYLLKWYHNRNKNKTTKKAFAASSCISPIRSDKETSLAASVQPKVSLDKTCHAL